MVVEVYASPLDDLTRHERDVLNGDWVLPTDVKAWKEEGRPIPPRDRCGARSTPAGSGSAS